MHCFVCVIFFLVARALAGARDWQFETMVRDMDPRFLNARELEPLQMLRNILLTQNAPALLPRRAALLGLASGAALAATQAEASFDYGAALDNRGLDMQINTDGTKMSTEELAQSEQKFTDKVARDKKYRKKWRRQVSEIDLAETNEDIIKACDGLRDLVAANNDMLPEGTLRNELLPVMKSKNKWASQEAKEKIFKLDLLIRDSLALKKMGTDDQLDR